MTKLESSWAWVLYQVELFPRRVRHWVRRANLVRRYREWYAEKWYGHDDEPAQSSRTGKMGWRCRACGRYSNGPVKAVYERCPARPGPRSVS
jgi:hypothetical protein